MIINCQLFPAGDISTQANVMMIFSLFLRELLARCFVTLVYQTPHGPSDKTQLLAYEL